MAKLPRLTDLEETTNEQPSQPAIPPGTEAKVRIDYTTKVNPSLTPDTPQARHFNDELYELAANEDEARPAELPYDPVTQFCSEWRNYTGWLLKVTRLPDPATRRMAGQQYNRTCLEIESLGSMPFDPANLEGILQIINGNSGGIFRIWLVDQNGQPVPDAFLDRVAIGDPPKQFSREHRPYVYDLESDSRYYREPHKQQQSTPAPPVRSEMELRLERIQERLLETALERALNPLPPAPSPGDGLSAEDRVGLYLLNQGGLIPQLMEKITALAGAPEAAATKETIGERALNAGLRIAETNPAIVERISSTLERILNRVLPDPRMPVTVASNLQPQQPQRTQLSQSAHRPVNTAPTGLPEAPNPEDDNDNTDDDVMDIIESLFTLLSDTRDFTINDPVFIELRNEYPHKFASAMQLIATVPLESIVAWISSQSTLFESLLHSPATGLHYRKRLAELQTFCRTPAPAPSTASANDTAQQPTPLAANDTTTTQETDNNKTDNAD